MAKYVTRMMDARTGNEGRYEFDGPDDLMSQTPVRIVKHFMEFVDEELFPRQHVDYELNAAMKNKDHAVVTAIGELHFEFDGTAPFMIMISR